MQPHLTSARTVGAFPISIGTSIAMEFLFGVQSEANPAPAKNSIGEYKEFWINVKTLFRNLYGSLEKTAVKEILPEELTATLIDEMELISSLVDQYSFNQTKVVFYISNYADMEHRYKMSVPRMDNTETQKMYSSLMRITIQTLLAKQQKIGNSDLKVFKLKLNPEGKHKTLILTHIAYDLVAHTLFDSLTLLESHTGAFKGRDAWHTKYYNGKELEMIPFLEGLLPVFGDNELFRPLNKTSREEIIALAKKYHWSPVTTREKILYGIGTLQNPFLKEAISSFFH